MEYVVPPFIFMLVLRFGFPALVTWFFEKVVEPKAELARQQNITAATTPIELTNAQKIAATRKSLNELKRLTTQSQ